MSSGGTSLVSSADVIHRTSGDPVNPPKMAAWNLGLRFLLELAALIGLGAMAWDLGSGVSRWINVIGAPLGAVAAWGIFNVVGDPSRSGAAPVRVSGWIRLVLELVILIGGAIAIGYVWSWWSGFGAMALILVHYIVSRRRVRWLVQQ